jgi:SNF2 family DNA or RNA helicase
VTPAVLLNYEFKTVPLRHQADELARSTEDEFAGYFWEPGLGKSYLIINQASFLYQAGKIDSLVIVAPNGVHLNWCSDEIPKHMPDSVRKRVKTVIYHSSKAKTKKAAKAREDLLDHDGLSVLVVAYEATITDTFKAYMKRFFAKRKSVFMCLDESHRIKGRSAKTKMTLVAMGKYAKYRRILTGTPVETPPDVYSQLRFLNQDFWKDKGFPTSVEFDAFFCEFEEKSFIKRAAGGRIILGPDGRPARNVFQAVTGYKNIDKLQKMVAETCTRLTLEQAGIHLPPITYSKRYYEMFPEQSRMYNELREEFRTEFLDGTEIDAEAAMTRLLRLQQVICGYCGTGPGEPIKPIVEGKNPRLDLLIEVLEDIPGQALIWARFTRDVDQICEALNDTCVRYDGKVDNDGRAFAKKKFQAGDAKYMVLSDAGAEGLTLIGAGHSVFYSNNFKMVTRVQKEARNYRIGQNKPVHVIDLVCEGTVDNDIIEALKNKKEISDELVGDQWKKWI